MRKRYTKILDNKFYTGPERFLQNITIYVRKHLYIPAFINRQKPKHKAQRKKA